MSAHFGKHSLGNGLLEECFSKGEGMANWTDERIKNRIKELDLRPKKCLG